MQNIFKDNSIFIIPNNIKNKIIKKISSLNKLINIKVITISELKEKLVFSYNTETIKYVMDKNKINYPNAKELIDNMYYLFEESYDNKKLDNLNKLKKELLDNNILIIDKYFLDSINNKEIYVYGFDYLTKYQLYLIDILKKHTKVEIISKESNNYNHPILSFNHLNDEIEFIANDIINKNIDLNNVYIYNINKDNENIIKRIFDNYNLKINLPSNISLSETTSINNYLNDFNLDNITDKNIKEKLISLLNKYAWCEDKTSIKDMLSYELQSIYKDNNKYDHAINITNLFNEVFDENDYIYIINFNNEYIPKIYKDTDFISDREKFSFLETTNEKNINEKNSWNYILHNIRNLTITSSNNTLKGPLTESTLVKDFNYEITNMNYQESIYSNKSNLFNLGICLDKYQKDHNLNDNLIALLNTYQNNNYNSYDNKYHKFNFKEEYSLSYSKMNTYYECPFKYYCDNILKLNEFEDNFDTFLGSLCHYILSKVYNNDFDYDQVKEEFFNTHPYELTKENTLFLNKVLSDFKIAIDNIRLFYNNTKYQTIETEKRFGTTINNIKFNGVIDKIMKYDNNIVLVDYKTGTPDIDLRLAKYGLNLQLPTYIYLIKTAYPESNIVGIYLQHILKPQFNKEESMTGKEQYDKSLKLQGYSLSDENSLKDFDPTYENSDFIAGLKLTSNGWANYSKVISKEIFDKLEHLTEEKIKECINNINDNNFEIKPKVVGGKNISCDYCPYRSVCFKKEEDNEHLTLDNSILGGDSDEMDN